MNNLKKGDKIRCIDPNKLLVLNKIYTFNRYDTYDVCPGDLLFVEGTDESFFTERFELVGRKDTLEDLVKKACVILESGKNVIHHNRVHTPSGMEVFTKPTTNSSPIVEDDIAENGFSVAIKMTNDVIIPVNQLTIASNIVKGVGDYEAIVEKDFIKVGCQTIPWSKVEEIVELHKKLS